VKFGSFRHREIEGAGPAARCTPLVSDLAVPMAGCVGSMRQCRCALMWSAAMHTAIGIVQHSFKRVASTGIVLYNMRIVGIRSHLL
jgi:hypothetical protein